MLDAKLLIARAKRLILFFTTPKQTERLIDAQKNLRQSENMDLEDNDNQLRIIADVPMRWNSSYLAWKRLIQIQSIISMMITNLTLNNDLQAKKDGSRLEKINLTTDEWNTISLLTTVLRPFAEATELLGGSKYATISFMYNAIMVIKQGLSFTTMSDIDFDSPDDAFDNDIDYEDEDDKIQENDISSSKRRVNINTPQNCRNLEEKIKSALYDAMMHYWDLPSDEAVLATILDPRCKPLSFMPELLKNMAFELLKDKYEESRVLYGTDENDNMQNNSNSLLVSMFYNRCSQSEISNYLGVQEIPWDQCPLAWWHANQKRFLVLSKLAQKYLAIPATSTASERLFSDAGNTMTIKRTSLLPTTFEHLVFLKKNWQLNGSVFPDANTKDKTK